jgi:hypothetical protein
MTTGVLCALAALAGFWLVIAFWPLGSSCRGRVYVRTGWRQCGLEAGHKGPCR